MMFFSKMFLSVLLVLGLVACPDDGDEKKEDFTLKVGSIDDVKAGGDFSVPVEVRKDDKVVTEGDGAKLKVSLAINCVAKESTDKEARKEAKPTATAAEKGKVTFSGTADASWKEDDKCTAKATADGAKEASGTFKILAADATDTKPAEPTELTITVTPTGEVTVKNADESHKIKLVKADGNPCEDAKLVSWPDSNVVAPQPPNGFDHDATDLWIVGGNTCKITVGDEEKTLSSGYTQPNKITSADVDTANEIDLTMSNPHGLTGEFTIVAQSTGNDPIVIEIADVTDSNNGIPNADTYTANKDSSFVDSRAYTVWIRHSAGVEEERVAE